MVWIVYYSDDISETQEYVAGVFETEQKAKECVKYKFNPKLYRIEMWPLQ